MFVFNQHRGNHHNHSKRMETIKAWGSIIEYLLGFGVTGLALWTFTLDDLRSILLLVLSGAFFCVKIYDAIQTAKIKRAKKKNDELDILIKRLTYEKSVLDINQRIKNENIEAAKKNDEEAA